MPSPRVPSRCPLLRPSRAAAWAALVLLAAGLAAPPAARAQRRGGDLTGRIVDRVTRAPLAGVRVQLVGTRVAAFTDSDGTFAMRELPSGTTIRFETRAIGYRQATFEFVLPTGTPVERVFELEPQNISLDTAVVTTAPSTNWRSENAFEMRRRRGIGYFITTEMIEERQPNSARDLLIVVPGLWTSCRGSRCDVEMMASGKNCKPEWFLDGYPATNAVGWDFPAQTIGAIEVYRSLFEVPAEFQRANLRCGVIAIWTRGFLQERERR